MSEQEKILERARALAQKAQGSGSTEAEMAASMAQLERYLTKHGICRTELDREKSPIRFITFDPKYSEPWRLQLANGVSRLYHGFFVASWGTREYKSRKTGYTRTKSVRTITFYGRGNVPEICESMYWYIERTILRLAKQNTDSRSECLEYEKAASLGVLRQISRILSERDKARKSDTITDNSNLPALTEREDVESRVRNALDLTSNTTKVKMSDSDAAYRGLLAGSRISLSDQVDHERGEEFAPLPLGSK